MHGLPVRILKGDDKFPLRDSGKIPMRNIEKCAITHMNPKRLEMARR